MYLTNEYLMSHFFGVLGTLDGNRQQLSNEIKSHYEYVHKVSININLFIEINLLFCLSLSAVLVLTSKNIPHFNHLRF